VYLKKYPKWSPYGIDLSRPSREDNLNNSTINHGNMVKWLNG
jgi:hypothetical protein